MARPKKEEAAEMKGIETITPVIPTKIDHIPVDYGREDINNIAKKINEIIDRLS